MGTFVATFSAVAVSAAQDLIEIAMPAGKRGIIREVEFGEYSDFGDAQAEILSVLLMRGHGTTGSGGAAVTPAKLAAAGTESAGATVARNNTTVATSGSPETLRATSWNVQSPFRYYPVPEERITLEPGQRFVVRITAPADAITMNFTIVFDEVSA